MRGNNNEISIRMREVKHVTVTDDEKALRLDKWFKGHYPGLRRGTLQKLLRTGQIRLNGRRVKGNYRLEPGQVIRVPPLTHIFDGYTRKKPTLLKNKEEHLVTELKHRILYKDKYILAIDKPSGLAVQGGTKTIQHLDGVLDNFKFGAKERPRLTHRLDRGTSGVLLLARSRDSAQWLTTAFKHREIEKLYWALVAGFPSKTEGVIDLPIEKLPGHKGEKMVPVDGGKIAKTIFKVVDCAGQEITWLALNPKTGRTHQLRAHAVWALKTPIIGDGKYGGPRAFPPGLPHNQSLQLHSRAIRLKNPDGELITLKAPLPRPMSINFKFLGFSENHNQAIFFED